MTVTESVCIFAAFDVWMYSCFLQGFFERRFETRWKHYLILAVFTIVLCFMNSRSNFYLNLFGGLPLFFGGATALYKGKLRSLFFFEMIYFVVVILMEAIASYIIIANTGGAIVTNSYAHLDNPINVIIAKMMTYLMLLIVMAILRKKKLGRQENRRKKIFILPISSLILMIGIQRSMEGEHAVMIVGTIFLLFANVFTFYYIEELVKAQEKNKELELLASQNEMKEIYYKNMEEVSIEHRKYVHNLKDYLQTIGGLAAQGHTKEILGLLSEMKTEIESIRETRYTGNPILNALLCEKESIAKKKEIAIQIEVAPSITFSFVKNRDLIVMVGNLLDNAIEAAGQCDDSKEINLYFSQEQSNFETIQIDNTYHGILQKDGEYFLTTKGDKEKHGFGLQSVEETAAKYGGVVLTDAKEGYFSTILTLSKKYYKE